MSNSETQAQVAPAAAPAKTKQEEQPQTPQKQQQRAMKLAPAPVPQQTPWKATPADQTPATDAAQPPKKGASVVVAAAAAASSGRSKERESTPTGGAKRATTGKEKWVPFAPVPIPSQQQQSGQRKNQKRREQNGSGNGGNNGGGARRNRASQGNNDKRREQRGGGSGHLRTHSRGQRDGADSSHTNTPESHGSSGSADSSTAPTNEVERLSLEDKPDRRFGRFSQQRNNGNGNGNGNMRGKAVRAAKVPYYAGGFIPGPGGVGGNVGPGYTMPVVPMAQVIPAMSTPEYLFATLVPQVNYYFSVENLCKDKFLRKNMNNEGLVPVSVIADFNRVRMLTNNIEMVSQACTYAANIETVGNKVRAAENWQQWILPESERTAFGNDNEEPRFKVDQAVPFVPKHE